MYRTSATYLHDGSQNESRADAAEAMLAVGSDKLGEREEERPSGVFTDVSDALAHFVHFCARAGAAMTRRRHLRLVHDERATQQQLHPVGRHRDVENVVPLRARYIDRDLSKWSPKPPKRPAA